MNRLHFILPVVLSGLLLSFPWLGILPGWILFAAFVPLLIAEEYIFQNKEQSAGIDFFGYAFLDLLLWNVLTTWWIMHASFFGMVVIVFLNALCMASVWWLFHLIKRDFNSGLASFSLVVFWLAFEYLHYNWDMEWPWLSLGNGFANQVSMVQWYEFSGVTGGSFWILIANLLLFHAIKNMRKKNHEAWFFLGLFILVVGVPTVISVYTYRHYQEKGETYEIVVLQPNVDPYAEKFEENTEGQQLLCLLNLADSLVTDSTDYVIGPETALHPLWENDQLMENFQIKPFCFRASVHPRLNFILGATTKILFQPTDPRPPTARKSPGKGFYFDIYNSALQINSTRKVQIYHKSILVSGVEKMPFSKYLSFIEKFIIDLGGTTGSLGKQEGPIIFSGSSGLNTAPVICFESIFGEYVNKYVKQGAAIIFIITNDGWWKDTPGCWQHLSYARLRAIETRRSIARSANTGISAFINQKGDLLWVTGWNKKTAIRGKLKSNDAITFYVRYGDYIGRASMFASIMILLYFLVHMKIKK